MDWLVPPPWVGFVRGWTSMMTNSFICIEGKSFSRFFTKLILIQRGFMFGPLVFPRHECFPNGKIVHIGHLFGVEVNINHRLVTKL